MPRVQSLKRYSASPQITKQKELKSEHETQTTHQIKRRRQMKTGAICSKPKVINHSELRRKMKESEISSPSDISGKSISTCQSGDKVQPILSTSICEQRSRGQSSAEKTKSLNKRKKHSTNRKKLENLNSTSSCSAAHIFQILCGRLKSLRNETKAVAMSKYMKNKFQFLGIPTPQRRAACADLWKDVKMLSPHDLRTLTCQAWIAPEREFHYFAVELLEREKFRLFPDDSNHSQSHGHHILDFIKTLITEHESWWDTIDSLATNVVGPVVCQYPDDLLGEMDKWNLSSNFWLCRISILYQLKQKKDTDVDRLFRYCLVDHKHEFFVQKAIGWALREYYKTDPKAVRSFVQKNNSQLSALSIREALKHDK